MQQKCRQCSATFEITDDDLAFYDKVSPIFSGKKCPIPPPTLCPDCRQQRRSTWRNEWSFHARTCSKCNRNIVSVYSDDVPFPVYCIRCWWSDEWDPLEFGQVYDPSRPFIEQFFEVNNRVPHIMIMNDNGVGSENCEYTQDFTNGKNCYMFCGGWYAENCYYCGGNSLRVKFAVDSYFLIESELCYECLDSRKLYNCHYLQSCEHCTDCLFGYDLKGCSNCFGCFGLRQKQFHWFNQPLPEKEYRNRLAAFDTGSFSAIQSMEAEFRKAIVNLPRKGMNLIHCENCTGDYLFNCKDVCDSYMLFNAQNSRFCDKGEGQVWCYDILHTGNPQYCYENLTPDNSYMTHFSMWCWVTKNVLYSDNCQNCEHLFGCTSMKRAKHCILNTQYSPEEYELLCSKIIAKMHESGEWGELFPPRYSPFGYSETMANDYVPLTEQEIQEHGWNSRSYPNDGKDGYHANQLGDSIDDIPKGILTRPLLCTRTGKAFWITKQELDFYQAHRIPIPRLDPIERHRDRFHKHNPQRIWNRNCMKCGQEMQTTYSPERPEIVYCESCYLAEVY